MKITQVKIRKIFYSQSTETCMDKLRAIVSVTFDDAFCVHDIRIIKGANRLFVGMPSRPSAEKDRHMDIAHPISPEFRKEFEETILTAYKDYLSEYEKGDA